MWHFRFACQIHGIFWDDWNNAVANTRYFWFSSPFSTSLYWRHSNRPNVKEIKSESATRTMWSRKKNEKKRKVSLLNGTAFSFWWVFAINTQSSLFQRHCHVIFSVSLIVFLKQRMKKRKKYLHIIKRHLNTKMYKNRITTPTTKQISSTTMRCGWKKKAKRNKCEHFVIYNRER